MIELGLYDDSIIEFKEAIRLNPDEVYCYYALGSVLTSKGEIKEAVKAYLEALKINPDFVNAQNAIMKLCSGESERKSAIYEYDIAISFAGENRSIAKEIADKLKASGLRVFFSDDYQELLWGEDQTKVLEDIFTSKAKYCMILVSKHYIEKAWPRLELNSAISRHMKQNKGYILQVKLDDSKLPGLPDMYGHVKFINADSIVDLTLKKIG